MPFVFLSIKKKEFTKPSNANNTYPKESQRLMTGATKSFDNFTNTKLKSAFRVLAVIDKRDLRF
jgi:hypothetical protein